MRLISLKLENFRQHSDSAIEFNNGITIINGSNGSGKSTILEAISWAIYGTEAARGNKDSIKWNKAPAKSKVKVDLVFALENEVFRVIRELNKAEVYFGANETPLAVTQDEVTKYLTDKLGMNRVEFFNTYFTGQKELNFLGNQKPVERRRFISKVLGYEKVREAQEKVRTDKNNITNEILGIKQGLGDIDKIESEKKESKEKAKSLSGILKEKQAEYDKYALEIGRLHPDWMRIKNIREDFNKFNTELRFINDKLVDLEKNIASLSNENTSIEEKSKKLDELENYLVEYKKVEIQIHEQEKLQKFEYEKQKMLAKLENTNQELESLNKKLSVISNSTKSSEVIPSKLVILRDEIDKLKKRIQDQWTDWTQKKQENKALIKQKETELTKVATQYASIEQKGDDGNCPTCDRPLKGEFDKVTSHYKEIIETLSKEIQILVSKDTEYAVEPEDLNQLKKILESKEVEFENLNKLQGKYEEELKLLESIKKDITSKNEIKINIESSLSKVPQGFDKELLEKLKEDFSALKKIYDEILGLKAQIINRDKVKSSLELANKNKTESEKRKSELEFKLKEINYSEEEYKNLEVLVASTEKLLNTAKFDVVKAEGELKQIQAILDKILESEKDYKEKLELISKKQESLNHLIELDRFYGQFLENLNNHARPEISELASKFLVELTDGRYTTLELNEKYEICLLDDGEVKPVISGGEEDVANLCIRIAISQMIAQRTGKSLSLLILDEVFGSLDENRRNNVVTLLYGLTNNFDQVILITHIEDIKEGIDNIIKVEYDEEQGCSIVSQFDEFDNNELNIVDLTEFSLSD